MPKRAGVIARPFTLRRVKVVFKKLLLTSCLILLLVPAYQARASAPLLTSSCSPCNLNTSIIITGSGFSDKNLYVYNLSTNTTSTSWIMVYPSVDGTINFNVGPITFADSYEVRIWQKIGRNLKVVATVDFIVS